MSELAIQLIAEAKRTNAKVLDLGNCGLTELPDELFELTELEELNVCNEYWVWEYKTWVKSGNKGKNNLITKINPLICNFKSLKILRINGHGSTNKFRISDVSSLKKLSGLHTLDLSFNEISDISFLQNLTGLRYLELSFNEISDISFLQNLSNIQSIFLNENQLSDVSFLQNLKELRMLYLGSNKISDISFLEKLNRLQNLNLSSNKISNFSLLENFSELQKLYLSRNNIRDVSFLKKLTSLNGLYLINNQISDISPLKSIIEKGVPVELEGVHKNSILLEGNPLKSPSPEIVKQGNQAILNWFNANKKALNELKLILIGDPQAGKTSILRKLKEDKFLKGEEQTDGINIESLVFKDLETFNNYPSLQEVTAHCWDFGGQETMNATHQFFMTKRCVYILVLHAREDNNVAQQIKKWASRITATGGNSSIIVLANQKDVNPGFGFVNEEELKLEFPQVKHFLKTSCKTGEGIEDRIV